MFPEFGNRPETLRFNDVSSLFIILRRVAFTRILPTRCDGTTHSCRTQSRVNAPLHSPVTRLFIDVCP